jgi:hypothetical protein
LTAAVSLAETCSISATARVCSLHPFRKLASAKIMFKFPVRRSMYSTIVVAQNRNHEHSATTYHELQYLLCPQPSF